MTTELTPEQIKRRDWVIANGLMARIARAINRGSNLYAEVNYLGDTPTVTIDVDGEPFTLRLEKETP